MVEHIQLLRNVGQFDSVDAGSQIPLTKLALIYAENGRGKTTLAAILRSLGTGDSGLIAERHRLGAVHPPHIVLKANGSPFIFHDGTWSAQLPQIAVYDDAFVAQNVCSGIEIEAEHRQNLHELILGAQGITLNSALQRYVAKIEDHNRTLRIKTDALATVRGTLTVDTFCALAPDGNIDTTIQEAERNLAAAHSAAAICKEAAFATLELPAFDTAAINTLLQHNLPELQADAAAHVQAHLARLGKNAAAWVGDGMQKIAGASADLDHEVCPFCAQDLRLSPLIEHYQTYFSDAYATLKHTIDDQRKAITATHGGEVPAAFERAVLAAIRSKEFWQAFTEVPLIAINTAEIARAWKATREAVLVALHAKFAAPLDATTLPPDALSAITSYDDYRASIAAVSGTLQVCNAQIAIVKERAATANVATLTNDLARLKLIQARHSSPVMPLCQAYLDEKKAKAATEGQRDQSRNALEQYRQNIFPSYEAAINTYLQKFNAGFRLGSVGSVNNRGGSSCTYNVLINNVAVSLTADTGPSFRNTLSAGDRNTLALAFFFASLDQDPQLAQKIVVIDDPMTSLDDHRSLVTVQEMRLLLGRVSQIIVLSHSKSFLCALWEDADTMTRSAIRIARNETGSTLEIWDVRQDCITGHDRRHILVTAYISASNPADERAVAAALRPILEAFIRVAYPAVFPPGSLLGLFLGICRQRLDILAQTDITELRNLLDYANRFHHDTNAAWETEAINDRELSNFCSRTLKFTQRS